jgi:hypothetical protein
VEIIPMSMLIEMLSSKSANLDKRIELAEEQIEAHQRCIDALKNALCVLQKRKKQG